jgi:YgiT-type zinc finger domain-containing protein
MYGLVVDESTGLNAASLGARLKECGVDTRPFFWGNKMMKKCNFCGATDYEERKTEYLYTYKGNYLLVPNTPVEICAKCGMVYFEASILKEIERRFHQSNCSL